MHTTDVIHGAAIVTAALFLIRAAQAAAEHFFPDAEATAAARYIYGGP